jgi:Calpain family cysteine protease
MATLTPRTAAVINPLALAELILGEPIKVTKPEELKPVLEKVLQTPFQELFDPKYRSLPYLLVELNGQGQAVLRQFPKELLKQPVKVIDEFVLSLNYKGYDLLPVNKREKLIWILLKGFPEVLQGLNVDGVNWRDPGDFYEEGTEFADPVQGALGDCYLIAALTAIAWARPYAILQRNRATGSDNQSFVDAIDIAETGSGTVSRIEVTERVPCNAPANTLIYGHSSEPTEIWPAVYEKAYGRWRNRAVNPNDTNYPGLNGGDGLYACCELVPGLTLNRLLNAGATPDTVWRTIVQNTVRRRTVNPMVAHTYASEQEAPATEPINFAQSGIYANHVYAILGWNVDPATQQRYVVLRNPHGSNPPVPNEQTGSWQAFDTTFWRTVPFQSNGVFSMPLEAFRQHFYSTDVAK